MTDTRKALEMAVEWIEADWKPTNKEAVLKACKEALAEAKVQESLNLKCKSVQKRLATQWGYVKAEAEKQEPVACPYPCGWDNLYKSIIEQGAYLARKRHENNENDEVFDEFLCSMNNIAKYLCEWGKSLTHPATWQSLSDDEIAIVIKTTFPVNVGVTNVDLKFARAIEAKLKEKNYGC